MERLSQNLDRLYKSKGGICIIDLLLIEIHVLLSTYLYFQLVVHVIA